MLRALAILFAIWATATCAVVDGNATAPAAAPSPSESVASAPQITPAPVGPPVRILWAPMQPQQLPVAVRVDAGVGTAARLPALVPATAEQLARAERGFVEYFGPHGLVTTLQSLRDQRFNGGEGWTFATLFAPGPFANRVRELITTRRDDESRVFHPGTAVLENAWVRPTNGVFGDPAGVGLLEGTLAFTDEVVAGGGTTIEVHRWHIRVLSQGAYVIQDGSEAPAGLAPLAPFDPATLDAELASQVSAYLHQEEVGPLVRPMSPYKATAFLSLIHI